MAEEKAKEVKMGRGPGMRGMPRPKIENPGQILARVFGILFKNYAPHMILVAVCIVVSVFANIQGTLFTRTLIDSYITPMVEASGKGMTPDFSPLVLLNKYESPLTLVTLIS